MLEILAAALSVFAASYVVEPIEQPKGTMYLPRFGTESFPEKVQVKPFSEFKWRNLVRQQYDFSCGSAALSTIIKFYLGNEDISELNAMRGMLRRGERQKIIERKGFSLLDMKRYMTYLGYQSNGFKAELSDIKGLDKPVIVPIKYGGFEHFVVLRSFVGGRALVGDPAFGNITLTETKFKQLWEPNVLFMANQSNKYAINKLKIKDEDLRYYTIEDPEQELFKRFQRRRNIQRTIDRVIQEEFYFP